MKHKAVFKLKNGIGNGNKNTNSRSMLPLAQTLCMHIRNKYKIYTGRSDACVRQTFGDISTTFMLGNV
jgi:hypothetical protein